MDFPQKSKPIRFSTILIVAIMMASLFTGGVLGYLLGYSNVSRRINDLQDQLSILQEQLTNLYPTQNVTYQNLVYVLGENASLAQLYEQVKESVVVIRGIVVQYDIFRRAYYSQVQGSGFVYSYTEHIVILTNYHVVSGAINITITLANGNAYAASVLGSDPYADLAVLSAEAPQDIFKPLEIVSSSSLEVGDPVLAVGNPYGLSGSMTIGIVSAVGRTITEEASGSYMIADIIQTTAPLNPGNSGGPLLNYDGQVIGITTAIVSGSQGLSFAIPSNSILREIESLVTKGSYNQHSWLGVSGIDMTYEIAQAIGINVTYGWLITQVTNEGPVDKAGLEGGTMQTVIAGELITVGGDVIIAINGTRITNIDDLSTYLEVFTLPGQTINMTIMRNNQTITRPVQLGTRPSASHGSL